MSILEGFLYREFAMKKESLSIFLSQLITPAIYLVLFVTSLSSIFATIEYRGKETPYLLFVLPGLIGFQVYFVFPFVASLISNDRRFGMLRTFFIAKGTPLQYVLAKYIAEGILVFGQCLLLLFLGIVLSNKSFSGTTIVPFFFVVFLSYLFWASLGIIAGLFITKETTRTMVFTTINLPLVFTAPVFYDLRQVPIWIQGASYLNPLRYQVSAMRDILITGTFSPTDILMLLILTIVVVSFSYYLLTRVSPHRK